MMRRLFGFIRPVDGRVKQILGINARNHNVVYRYNPRRHFGLADDKLRTKEILEEHGINIPKTYHVFSWMHQIKTVPKVLADFSDFVIKPASGKAGSGILVITGKNGDRWQSAGGETWTEDALKRHVGNVIFGNYANGLDDRAIVEERLIQGPLFDDHLFPGLPDIRIITLKGEPLMAMLRIPTSHSGGKANLHQGAVGVGIDLTSGRTNFATYQGDNIDRHPDTDEVLTGRQINCWPEILSTAKATASALPLGYLGVDIALSANRGPVILEANVRPGLEIQNANRQGLVPVIAEANQEAVSS